MLLKNADLLVVDDDPDILIAVRLLLKNEVKSIRTESNPNILTSLIPLHTFDLILLDMNFTSSIHSGNEGLFWLKRIKEMSPNTPIIMITAYSGIDLAVKSLKEGAMDFIVKPWHNEKLIVTLKDILQTKAISKEKNKASKMFEETSFIGESEGILDVLKKIEKIAPTEANILILGENGTGKDLVAQVIHAKSLRNNKHLVKVDIGSLTESIFESELFGYKKGAFTDAKEDRMGRFESAQEGTLFLDEIGNIQLGQQARLLSVLQNREVNRLGSNQSIPIDIRLICATNLAFSELNNEKRFRKDLLYRINTVEIIIPPLRERNKDIELLAHHFSQFYSKKYLKADLDLTSSALKKLKKYTFPGNVRELQYIIERAVIMCEKDEITESDIIFSKMENPVSTVETEGQIDTNLSNLERNAILIVMEKHSGNITKVAKDLGITRTALYRRLTKYGI